MPFLILTYEFKRSTMDKKKISDSVYIVNTVKGAHFISFDKIKYFKADGRYTWIIQPKGESLVTKNIGLIEKERLPDIFARIHYSILVNMFHITYCNWVTREVVLLDGTILKIAERRLSDFRKKLQLLHKKLHLLHGSL